MKKNHNSSLALFITGILAAHIFLKSGWKKAILICSILPIAILKNGIRIVILSTLAIYVDEKFITQGFLHGSGGSFFSSSSYPSRAYPLGTEKDGDTGTR